MRFPQTSWNFGNCISEYVAICTLSQLSIRFYHLFYDFVKFSPDHMSFDYFEASSISFKKKMFIELWGCPRYQFTVILLWNQAENLGILFPNFVSSRCVQCGWEFCKCNPNTSRGNLIRKNLILLQQTFYAIKNNILNHWRINYSIMVAILLCGKLS